MSNDFNDDLAGIFDDLNPEDFARETSAVASAEYDDIRQGREEYLAFVDANLHHIRSAYDEDPDNFDPIGILHTPEGKRVFLPDDDETNEMFMLRLQREATEFQATWFFIGMIAPAAVCADRDEAVGGNFVMQDSLCWYAEAREPRFNNVRQGIIVIHKDKTSGDLLEGDPEGASYLFRMVLNPKLKTS